MLRRERIRNTVKQLQLEIWGKAQRESQLPGAVSPIGDRGVKFFQ